MKSLRNIHFKTSLPLGTLYDYTAEVVSSTIIAPCNHQFITLVLNNFITLTYLVLMKEQTQLTLASEINKGPLQPHSCSCELNY